MSVRYFYYRFCAFRRSCRLPLSVRQRQHNRHSFPLQLLFSDIGISTHFYKSGRSPDFCRYLYSRSPIIIQIKMYLWYDQKFHFPIDPPVESKIGSLRIDFFIFPVVCFHKKFILLLQQIRYILTKSRISILVCKYRSLVPYHFCTGIYTVKLQIHTFPIRIFRLGDTLLIITGSAKIIVISVLSVYSVPCMRQIYQTFFLTLICKLPVLHQLYDSSHCTVFLLSCLFSAIPYFFILTFTQYKTF